jgi:hypothetical protein
MSDAKVIESDKAERVGEGRDETNLVHHDRVPNAFSEIFGELWEGRLVVCTVRTSVRIPCHEVDMERVRETRAHSHRTLVR